MNPNPRNPRKITDEKLALLKKRLNEFGDLGGIVFNRRTKTTVGGHQRLMALKEHAPKPVIVHNYQFPTRAGTVAEGFIEILGERFIYREVDWDQQKEKAAMIAANKSAGDWDFPVLTDLINELDASNFNLELLGFDSEELENMMAFEGGVSASSENEDIIPEIKESFVKEGELWLLGNHRLLCGDCTVKENVERLMNGEKADMVYTDPPYGMDLDTDYDAMFAFGDHTHTGNRFEKIAGDNEKYDPSPILSIKAKRYFIWGCDYFYEKLPTDGCFVAWDKRNENLDRVPGNTTEFCWASPPVRRTSARIIWSGHYGMSGDDSGPRMHPTQKPIKLAEWFFDNWGKDMMNIVDLYLGSGSTLIACEKTARKCFGTEIDPRYCSIIIERWEKFTGQKAVLQS